MNIKSLEASPTVGLLLAEDDTVTLQLCPEETHVQLAITLLTMVKFTPCWGQQKTVSPWGQTNCEFVSRQSLPLLHA